MNVNCPQMRLDCLLISRKGRKGELRTITENYPTQNANPQTLAITGVSADCVYCAKRMRPWGLNPHFHALVAELHYHDGAALQAGADGCCAVGSS